MHTHTHTHTQKDIVGTYMDTHTPNARAHTDIYTCIQIVSTQKSPAFALRFSHVHTYIYMYIYIHTYINTHT